MAKHSRESEGPREISPQISEAQEELSSLLEHTRDMSGRQYLEAADKALEEGNVEDAIGKLDDFYIDLTEHAEKVGAGDLDHIPDTTGQNKALESHFSGLAERASKIAEKLKASQK